MAMPPTQTCLCAVLQTTNSMWPNRGYTMRSLNVDQLKSGPEQETELQRSSPHRGRSMKKNNQRLNNSMERADAGSSGHFPLFSALGFTSALCITLSSPQLAEGATAAQLGVAEQLFHIFLTFDGFKQLQHGDDGLHSYARPFIGPTHNHAKVLSALKSLIQHA